jgi:hypothetical protein
MDNMADSIAVKILIGVATAAVWFMLSRAASAEQPFADPFAHPVQQSCFQQTCFQQTCAIGH